MSINCIIQARLGSSRLPGKVLREIKGKSVLLHCLEQISYSTLIDDIIVATTTNPNDNLLVEKVKSYGYEVFRGNEEDLLDRYYQAARAFNTKIIVRVTSDCPLVDPEVIDKTIKAFQNSNCDYCCNAIPPTYPDGYDTEVFTFETLEKAWREASLISEREHVSPYIWKNKDKFKFVNLENDVDLSHIRITVDQKEDFMLIEKIINKINKSPILLRDIMKLLEEEPELLEINKMHSRNEGYAKSVEEDRIVK